MSAHAFAAVSHTAPRVRAARPLSRTHRVSSRTPAATGNTTTGSDFVDASVLANNAASLDGKLRTLVVGVTDFQGDERLGHRNATSGTLFKHDRWLDQYTTPGQEVTLVDLDSGKSCKRAISVSPYRARATAPNTDVSVVEFLLDSGSDDGDENFFAKAQPPCRLLVSSVTGSGFANPMFRELNLKNAVDDKHALVLIAGGARGIGPMRAALEWPVVASHADKYPVTLFYLNAGAKQSNGKSSAFVEEWDEWRAGGVGVVPLFGGTESMDGNVFQVQSAIAGGVPVECGGKGRKILGNDAEKVTVLMAGLTREETKTAIAVFCDTHGVPKSNLLNF